MLSRYLSSVVIYLSMLAILFLFSLILIGCAAPVIKMPKPMPDIVKEYKSVVLYGDKPGMHNSGVRVKEGDYIMILADGEIDVWPAKSGYTGGPNGSLLIRIGEKNFAWRYYDAYSTATTVKEDGNIYLGVSDGPMDRYGKPSKPEYYSDNKGYFVADIIVWKQNDPIRIADVLEDASRNNPKNTSLRISAGIAKNQKEILLAEKKKTEEVEKTKEAIAALKAEEVSGVKEAEKEKQIAELNERLLAASLALKDLEDMKRKMAEQQAKEKELMARLEQAEAEKLKPSKNPPLIAIASPKDGTSVDFEYISIAGVAESGKGIAQLEILVNQQAASRKNQRDLQLVARDLKQVDFSENIRLREGKNEIVVVAQDSEGLVAQKTLSIQLIKKRGEVWAVVIGISRYKGIPSLKYAANDAREFYRYLAEVNAVPKDHIWLLLDEEATLDNLKSTLGTQLRRQAGKDDMVIIYLAGHGATEKDATSPDGDGLEKYILPYNANPKDLYASAMPMSEVARIFNRISSERLVFISDTCYSGASGGRTVPVLGARANVSGAFLDRLSQGKGRVIITASDANEVSVEKDDLKHGVFTYYLLEALRGQGDTDKDGVITVDEVYRYVSMKVPQATGQDQHPVKKGEVTGQIVLGVVK
jgi:hypothetical protein